MDRGEGTYALEQTGEPIVIASPFGRVASAPFQKGKPLSPILPTKDFAPLPLVEQLKPLLVFYFCLPCEDLSGVYGRSDQSRDEENFRC